MDAAKTGCFIAKLRYEQGLTQQQLAEKLHVTYKAVSRWETGRGTPGIENLEALSCEPGVSVAELLHGERLDDMVPAGDADELARDSISFARLLLHRSIAENAVCSVLAGLIAVLFIVIRLASPCTISYHDGLVEVERTEGGILLASIEDGVTGCDINFAADPDTGETIAYISCYSKLWSAVTGTTDLGWHAPGMRCAVAIGSDDTVARVYYYSGEIHVPKGRSLSRTTSTGNVLLYARDKSDGFDAITQPRRVYDGLIIAAAIVGAVGLAVFAMLRKRRYARFILLAALLPLCLAASTAAVLRERIDQVFNASFYLSGISLLTLALYSCACIAVIRPWNDKGKGGWASDSLTRRAGILVGAASVSVAVAFAACVLHARLNGGFRSRTVFIPTDDYILQNGFPVNASGQTYGPSALLDTYGMPLAEPPDLMLAQGVDGVVGYVYRDDLMGSEPATIEEAIASQRTSDQEFPLYDRDGKTVIGTYLQKAS